MLRRSHSQRFFRLALYASLFAFLLLILAAWGRVHDAGLGCPDWPGCPERLFAPQTAQDVNEARSFFPRQSPEELKLFKETLHRYLSGALGLIIIRLAWLGWTLKKHVRRQQVWIPAIVTILVFAQVIASIVTVRMVHKPLVAMGQFSASLTILGLLWWIVLREHRIARPAGVPTIMMQRLRPRALLALLLVCTQVAFGGWVSVNYAGLACPDFPLCQGQLWPPMNVLEGFTLWRDVGLDYEGILLNLEGATALHVAHRIGAVITLLYVGWLALHVIRHSLAHGLLWYGLLMLVPLLAQVTLGIMQVQTHLPVALVVTHSAVAALLLLTVITFNHAIRPRP
jgi:cytochrome c oxidase assembly protein subunit 15